MPIKIIFVKFVATTELTENIYWFEADFSALITIYVFNPAAVPPTTTLRLFFPLFFYFSNLGVPLVGDDVFDLLGGVDAHLIKRLQLLAIRWGASTMVSHYFIFINLYIYLIV